MAKARSEAEWQQMRQWHPQGDEQIRKLWSQMNALKDSYEDMSFTPPHLATIQARTLIVHGPIFGDLAGRFVETALAFLRGGWDGPGWT